MVEEVLSSHYLVQIHALKYPKLVPDALHLCLLLCPSWTVHNLVVDARIVPLCFVAQVCRRKEVHLVHRFSCKHGSLRLSDVMLEPLLPPCRVVPELSLPCFLELVIHVVQLVVAPPKIGIHVIVDEFFWHVLHPVVLPPPSLVDVEHLLRQCAHPGIPVSSLPIGHFCQIILLQEDR